MFHLILAGGLVKCIMSGFVHTLNINAELVIELGIKRDFVLVSRDVLHLKIIV